jgi:hypothetical protein
MGYHMQQTPWWSIASTVASALAAVAVAFFAFVELLARRDQRRERQRTADARLGATAFLVRRQLRSWLGKESGSPDDLEGWAHQAQSMSNYTQHVDRAETRFIEMLSLAPDASPSVASATRTAAAQFFNGTEKLNEFLATSRPTGIDVADWVELRNMAWEDLRDCVNTLDTDVGLTELLSESRRLDAARRAKHPTVGTLIGRWASALERLQGKGE